MRPTKRTSDQTGEHSWRMSLVSKKPRLRSSRSISSITKIMPEVSSFADSVDSKAKLEKVLGCTAISRSSVSVDENKGIIAYPAGSTVILFNPKTNAQAHLIGSTKNSLTCLSFSKCGKYVATGECGHEPRVRVWELYDSNGQFVPSQAADIKYHQLGISCVRFTPDGNHVISVGNQHDKAIVLWDWRKQRNVAENRLTSKVNAMDITEEGSSYVTVGVRHVKFWHVSGGTDGTRSVPLQGRSAILAEQRNNTFLDVCCSSNNRTFSITEAKLLLEFRDKKLVGTYDLHGEMPRSLVLGANELFVGFNNGTIRCLDAETMVHKYSYCKPHYLFCDVSRGTSNEALLPGSHPTGCRYPDVRALCYNKIMGVLTAVYSDRSIYNWQQMDNGTRFSKLSSQLFHVGAVYALEIYPSVFPWLPAGTFISGGADETVRIWNIDQRTKLFEQDKKLSLPQTNVFSEELKKVIFLSTSIAPLTEPAEKVLAPSATDVSTGVRALRVSPDGRHLASGGRDGNVCVFDLTKPDTPQIVLHEAHENEVMCLEYSDPLKGRYLLASGSRDRLVHLFDPLANYVPLATVDDHSSTVNSIVFAAGAEGVELITCAADKLVVIRRMTESEPKAVSFSRTNQVSSQFGLNNMALLGDGIVTACQDRQLRMYSMQGKLIKQVRGSSGDDGQLTKVKLDPSGTFAATVCTDRNVYIVEAATGDCAAVLSGQSETITDVGFTPDCRRLIVVSYSGCVFVWRLSNLLSSKMTAKLRKTSTSNHLSPPGDKINERPETPDSLIGSGSDVASEEPTGPSRSIKVKDSESEFGSLNSLRIADEDDDSCIGQKPAKVVLNVSTGEQEDFELKRVATEVVRRSNSGVLSNQNSNWDIASAANDFSDEETTGDGSHLSASGSTSHPGSSSAYTTSRSMSNLHPSLGGNNGSPRRPRKKWDMTGDVAGYSAPVMLHQKPAGSPQGFAPYNSNGPPQLPQTQPPPLQPQGGFMTMNGTHIYHAPSSSPRRDENTSIMNSSMSMPGINQLVDQQPIKPQLQGGQRIGNDMISGSLIGSAYPPNRQFTTSAFGPPSNQAPDNSFERAAPERCSLTKKFLNSPTVQEQPRTVWTPPAMSTRRAASNMHYSTPSGGSASTIVRRQSEMHNPGTRLYQQNSNNPTVAGEDPKAIRRARTIHRLKHRRLTIGSLEETPSTGVINSPKEEDYVMSDLHLRSRSQSPSQLALNGNLDGSGARRQRQDSDVSMYSTLTMASSRMTPSSSRTNLRTVGLNNRQSSQALNKLNEMRDKLRKSQENLAGAIGDEGAPSSSSAIMSRSRSIGNLRFTAALPVNSQRVQFTGYNGALPTEASTAYMPASAADMERKCSQGSQGAPLSTRSRFIARSVGSLHNQESPEHTHEELDIPRLGAPKPRRLAQTIESLKKASNPDLTQLSLYDNVTGLEGNDADPFYSSSTSVPRNQRGKGAVQKRVERYQPRNRTSRDTTSGESDSNASDANISPLLQSGNVISSQMLPKRYFSSVNGSNRSASSVEGMPRPGSLQCTRRIFEQQRHNSSSAPRRAPNYLAQKLAGGDIVGPDMGAEECPRQPSSLNEAFLLHEFEGKTPQSKKMARHIAECLEQFNTGLDKVLQARQLLETSQHLPSDDKDMMLRVLNQAIRTGRKRLDLQDDRYEPDGGRSDSPNSISSQRQNATQTTPGIQQLPTTGAQPDIDPAVFIQQHGHQLLALLQQNMAKQN